MFNIKELSHILLALIILIFVALFGTNIKGEVTNELILITVVGLIIVVFTSIIAKKLAAYYFESKAEFKIWNMQRLGFKPHQKLKKPIPAGIIVPFLVSILSFGNILWLAVLEFDVRVLPSRASKRHEIYKFKEMTDIHLGLIASAGVISTLILSIIAYFAVFPEVAKLSIYYTAFSLLPFGNLDGTKIYFGNKTIYITLVAITLIFLGYALFLV